MAKELFSKILQNLLISNYQTFLVDFTAAQYKHSKVFKVKKSNKNSKISDKLHNCFIRLSMHQYHFHIHNLIIQLYEIHHLICIYIKIFFCIKKVDLVVLTHECLSDKYTDRVLNREKTVLRITTEN